MSAEAFRRLALELPKAVEFAQMGQPDFRVGGKTFASLWPAGERGILKLTREQQEMLAAAEPELFAPVSGVMGRKGWTRMEFDGADEATMRSVLGMAWRNTAPKRLAAAQEEASLDA